MTEETTDARGPRSSLLYAMGALSALSQTHSEEISKLRQGQDEIPAKVVALLEPRLRGLEETSGDHGRRIRVLERRQWLQYGGGAALLVGVGWLVEVIKPIALIHQ